MPGPLRWRAYNNFAAGWWDDPNPANAPDGALDNALNVFVSGGGALIGRGTCGADLAVSYTPIPLAIGGIKSLNVDGAAGVAIASWNGSTVDLHAISPTATSTIRALTGSGLTTLGSTVGTPFTHRDTLIFPNHGGQTWGLVYGGYVGTLAGASGATARTITAGSDTITGFSGAETATFAPGMLFYATDASSNLYYYRVTAVGATTITVSPTPTLSATTSSWQVRSHLPTFNIGTPHVLRGAKTACSFQNRIVAANVTIRQSGASSDSYHPNRLIWSILPTEQFATYQSDGLGPQLSGNAFGQYNFIDVQNTGAIQAVVPVGQGTLAILGREATNLLVGNLETITATAGGIGYSVQELGTNTGCLDTKTVQRAQSGAVWASPGGVLLFDGAKITNLTAGRIGKAWTSYFAESTIYGSALVRGEGAEFYLLSTSAGCLCINLLNGACSVFNTGDDILWTSCTLLIAGSCADPVYPQRAWGIAGGTSVGASTAKILHLDSMVNPTATQLGEAFGPSNTFTASFQTKAITNGTPTQLKRFRHAKITLIITATGSTTVTFFPTGREAQIAGQSDQEAWTISSYSASNPARTNRFDMHLFATGVKVQLVGLPSTWRLGAIEIASQDLNPGRT